MNNPLVSIIVITYNSSKYVLETLESIKNQTYDNLELIISDDCSTDNTKEICLEFINNNSHINFIKNAKLVQTQKNSGITPNYNNGLKYATGRWLKYIAGDDSLNPNCIFEYVEYTKTNDEKLIMSKLISSTGKRMTSDAKEYKQKAHIQLKNLLTMKLGIAGSVFFIERNTLEKLNGFDERYPFIEDYPFVVKLTKANYKIGYIDKQLVQWRSYSDSVSHSNKRYSDSILNFLKEGVYPELLNQKMYFRYWDRFLYYNIILKNHPSWLKKVTILINPIGIQQQFQKLLCNK